MIKFIVFLAFFSGCTSSPKAPAPVVPQTCADQKTATGCNYKQKSDGYCGWDGNKCQVVKQCSDLTTLGLCDSGKYPALDPCVWQVQNGPCFKPTAGTCNALQTQSSCIAKTGCFWSSTECQLATACSQLTASGQAQCDAANLAGGVYCNWNSSTSTCQQLSQTTPCTDIQTEIYCKQHTYKTTSGQDNCYWDTSSATASCKKVTSCSSISASSVGKTEVAGDCNALSSDPAFMCTYDAVNNTCLDSCSKQTQANCDGYMLGCSWDGSECVNDCSKKDQAFCSDSESDCRYDSAVQKCFSQCVLKAGIDTCSSYNNNQADCTSNGCSWQADSGCSTHDNDESGCKGDNNCAWTQTNACDTRSSSTCPGTGCDYCPNYNFDVSADEPKCTAKGCSSSHCASFQETKCKATPVCGWFGGSICQAAVPDPTSGGSAFNFACYASPSNCVGTSTQGTCSHISGAGTCSDPTPSRDAKCGAALNKSQCTQSYCQWAGGQ